METNNYRKDKVKPAAPPQPAKLIKVRDENFRLIDLDNEWTFEMNQICKPFIQTMILKTMSAMQINKVLQSGVNSQEEMMSNVRENLQSGELDVTNLIKVSFELDGEFNLMEFMALLYWERDEIEFEMDVYKERIKKFNKMNDKTYETAKVALDGFFTGKMGIMVKNSLTFLQTISQTSSIL